MKVSTAFAWATLLSTAWACGCSDSDEPSTNTTNTVPTSATGPGGVGTMGATTGGDVTTTQVSSTGSSATGSSATGSSATTGMGQSTSASGFGVGGMSTTGFGNMTTGAPSGAGGSGDSSNSSNSSSNSSNTSNTSSNSSSSGTSTTGGMAGCESGPLEAPIPNCSPEPVPDTGDYYADCVARINQFRWECQCLPPLERWVEAEDCADQQARYDYEQNSPHQGARDNICQPSGAQNECPNYGPSFGIVDFCLQQMWDEGPGEDFNTHGHYLNMSNPNFERVACGIYETPEGNIWAVQNFN